MHHPGTDGDGTGEKRDAENQTEPVTRTPEHSSRNLNSPVEVAEVLADNLRIFKVVLNHPHIVQYK